MRRASAIAATLLLLVLGAVPPALASSPSWAAPTSASTSPSMVAAAAGSTVPGGLVPLPAHRLLDTRSGLGAPRGAVAAGTSLSLAVAGREGIPAGTSVVAITVTAVSPTGAGFVTAHAHGTPTPSASSLNFAPGQTTPNLVVAQVSSDGIVDLTVGGSGAVHLLADVAGYIVPGAATDPATLRSVTPARVLDTRSGVGAPKAAVAGGSTVTLPVSGRGGVPRSGAGTVVLNVTVTGGTAAGYVAVAPTVVGTPRTSSLNYAKAQTRANLVVVPLSSTGTVDLRVVSGGTVQLIADVVGWVPDGVPSVDGALTAVSPVRLLDTRTSNDPLGYHDWATVDVVDVAGVPAHGVSAVLLNVTATGATATGNLSVLPNGPGLPTGSNLNFLAGSTEANLVLAPVSAEGFVDIFATTSGSVHVVADVVGYVLGDPLDTSPPQGVTGLTTTQPAKNTISLGWTNPGDADFTGVTIRRVVGPTPSDDPLVGQVVAETTGATFTDSDLTPGTTYSYTLWAHDGFPNVAQPATTTATTTSLEWGTPAVVAPYVGAPSTLSCPTSTWCIAGDWSGQSLTWNGTSWSAPARAVDVDREEDMGGFHAIGCASTTFCAASVLDGGLVTYSKGVWGSIVRPTLPAGIGGWNDVDCVSTTFCMAVNGSGYVTRFNGTTWSTPVRTSGYYWSVDCVSTTFCMAAGQDTTVGAGYAARYNGSTWTVSKIAGAGTSIYAVSCASTTFCVSTGSAIAVRWNGSTWSAPATLDSSGSFQGRQVSCTSSSFCVTTDPDQGAKRWNGTTWSAATRLSSVGALNGALSCASTTCLATDQHGRFSRYNGSTWTSMATFDPTRGGIVDLSCPSTSGCQATDGRGAAYGWGGSSWSGPTQLGSWARSVACATTTWCVSLDAQMRQSRLYTGSWAASVSTPADLGRPSCPVTGWCVAFDSVGRASTTTGSGWSTPKAVFAIAGASYPTFVDCVSRTSCVAVTAYNAYWSRWDGTSWSPARRIDSRLEGAEDVACASTTMCLAVNYDGASYRFTGSSWQKVPTSSTVSQVYDLSCPAANFCAGLDGGGRFFTFNGQTWNDTVQQVGVTAPRTFRLDCPAVYTCVAAASTTVVTSR
ncbi:MAG TPA: hypothetical protein VFL38_00695 [Humibacillus xanthopallidus]|nr:hypothetical protein [Humibacillus xanthopallidus]